MVQVQLLAAYCLTMHRAPRISGCTRVQWLCWAARRGQHSSTANACTPRRGTQSCLIQGVSLSLCRQATSRGRQAQPGAVAAVAVRSLTWSYCRSLLLLFLFIVIVCHCYCSVYIIIYDIVSSPLYPDNKVVR